jgi:CYTH domain-containing protein
VHKRRHTVRGSDDLVWEIDEFLDRDLVLAEVELPSAETEFELPSWLSEALNREVTDDEKYSNLSLAQSYGNGTRPTDVGKVAP